MPATVFCQREGKRFDAGEFDGDIHETAHPHTTTGVSVEEPVHPSPGVRAFQKIESSYALRPSKGKGK